MYVADNTVGLCLPNKIITVCSDDRRPINIFCGKTASFCMLSRATLLHVVTVLLFPANDAEHCSVFSSLYMP